MPEELNQVEAQPTQETTTTAPQETKSDREYNMRIIRERMEATERRNKELEAALQQKQQEVVDDDDDDSFVEKKHLKKYESKLAEVTEELTKARKELEHVATTSVEYQIKSKYNDFDKIVNDENMERLKNEKPALYRSILHNPDLRDKAETAYEAINAFVQPNKYAQQDRKIEENKDKPRVVSTVSPQPSDSPLTRVDDYDRRELSREQKKELLAEMRKYGSRFHG